MYRLRAIHSELQHLMSIGTLLHLSLLAIDLKCYTSGLMRNYIERQLRQHFFENPIPANTTTDEAFREYAYYMIRPPLHAIVSFFDRFGR